MVEIFEATPQVGRNFITLADFAYYYLIFAGFILFNINFERPERYDGQGRHPCMASTFFVLPFVGSVLALRTRLMQGRSPWPRPTTRR